MLLLVAVVVSCTVLQAAPQHFLFSKIYLQLATHIDIGPFHDARYTGAQLVCMNKPSNGQFKEAAARKKWQQTHAGSCAR